MLTRKELKQLKAAVKGMALYYVAPKDYKNDYWVKKSSMDELLETFAEEAPPKPKKLKETTKNKSFSRVSPLSPKIV